MSDCGPLFIQEGGNHGNLTPPFSQQAAQQVQQQQNPQPTDQQLFQLYTTIASVYGNDVSMLDIISSYLGLSHNIILFLLIVIFSLQSFNFLTIVKYFKNYLKCGCVNTTCPGRTVVVAELQAEPVIQQHAATATAAAAARDVR